MNIKIIDATMKHFKYFKKLISIILSFSLIGAGVPAELSGKSCLAPPGEFRELTISLNHNKNKIFETMEVILSSVVTGIIRSSSEYRIVDTGSTARGTDVGRTDYDLDLFFKNNNDLARFWESEPRISEFIASELQKRGYEVKRYRSGKKKPMGTLITISLFDGDGEEVNLQITVGMDKKIYADYYKEQMRQIAKLGGSANGIRADIILMKKLFKYVLHCYKQYHGGMEGVGIEQLIIQSAGARNYGRKLQGIGTFDRALRWIYAKGFNKASQKGKSLDEVVKKCGIYHPGLKYNFLTLLNPMSWRRIVNAARKYVELEEFIFIDEDLDKLRYTLSDALSYREDKNYVMEVSVPMRYTKCASFFDKLADELIERGLITSFSSDDIEIVDKDRFYIFFNTSDPEQLKKFLKEQKIEILSETNKKSFAEVKIQHKEKERTYGKIRDVSIVDGLSILVEKRILDEFSIKERDLVKSLLDAIGPSEYTGIYYETRDPFLNKLKEFTEKTGRISIVYSDTATDLFPSATKDGVITISSQIKKLPKKFQLEILGISILNQFADITGPIKIMHDIELPDLLGLIYPSIERGIHGRYYIEPKYLEKYFELKKLLPKHDELIKSFRRIITQEHRILKFNRYDEYIQFMGVRDMLEKARFAYVHSFGNEEDIKKAFVAAATILKKMFNPPEPDMYYPHREMYCMAVKAGLPALVAYNSVCPEAYAVTETILWIMGHPNREYFTEEKMRDLKKYDFDALLALTDIDTEMDREQIDKIIDHMGEVHYSEIDTLGLKLIKRIAVTNRQTVLDLLFDKMKKNYFLESKCIRNIPEVLAFVGGEEIFDLVVNKFEQAEEEEKHIKDDDSLKHFTYMSNLKGTLMHIGGERAVKFFIQRVRNVEDWFSYSDLAKFIHVQLRNGNFNVLDIVDKDWYSTLFEEMREFSDKIESGDYADDDEKGKLEGKYQAYLNKISEIIRACMDAEVFKKNYSSDLEEWVFHDFSPESFKHIKDIKVKDYFTSRLMEFADTVKSDLSIKKILFAFCMLSEHDVGYFRSFLDDRDSKQWMDYVKYADVMCAMGDMLAEGAERTEDKQLAAKYLPGAKRAHLLALDNFQEKPFKLIKHTIRENDKYRNYLIGLVNKQDIDALRILLTDELTVKRLLRQGTIKPGLEGMVQSFCLNQFNTIVSTYSDMVKQFEQFLVKGYFIPLGIKLNYYEELKPVLLKELMKFLEESGFGFSASNKEVIRIIEDMGFSIYGLDNIIIPNLSVLDSGYRGTREKDHSDARFTTRAISVAIMHYGWKGGEFASRSPYEKDETAQGNTVIQEIDYNLAPKEKRIDHDTALCVEFLKPIPRHAYKRVVLLGKKPVASIIMECIKLQSIEYKAKLTILNEADKINRLGGDDEAEFKIHIKEIQDSLEILHYKNGKAGLCEEYFKHVYGPLEAYLSAASFDNRNELANIFTIVFLNNEYSQRLSFPHYPVSKLKDEKPETAIRYIQKVFFEGIDYAPAVKYLHNLSFTKRAEIAQSHAFRLFLKKLITTGLKPSSTIRLTDAMEIMYAAGLLNDILPGLDDIDRFYSDKYLLRRPKDRVFALARSIEQDARQNTIKNINFSMAYLIPFIRTTDTFRDLIDQRKGGVVNPFCAAEKLGFSTKQMNLIKAAFKLKDALLHRFGPSLSTNDGYPLDAGTIERLIKGDLSSVDTRACAELKDYELRAVIDMTMYLYLKNTLIDREAKDPSVWQDTVASIDRWRKEVLPLLDKIRQQIKELKTLKKSLHRNNFDKNEEQSWDEAIQKQIHELQRQV